MIIDDLDIRETQQESIFDESIAEIPPPLPHWAVELMTLE
jgi:hypothetical protein